MSKTIWASAGDLFQTITLVSPSASQGTMGGVSEDGLAFATIRAGIKPLSGRELALAKERVAEVTHQITIRYLAGVHANQHVSFGTRTFIILAVTNKQENNR